MNDKIDNEYIRDAVKLADGWSFKTEFIGCSPSGNTFSISFMAEQEMLDALVAQLISQVDETDYRVRVSYDETIIYHMGELYAFHKGDDRSMNSLKAILDSRVLVMNKKD